MFFNSFSFILFFIVVFTLFTVLRKVVWARNLLLVIASYFFYGCWNFNFLSLIMISTGINYICGLLLNATEINNADSSRVIIYRKLILVISLVTSLGILCFFKYYNFFISSALVGLKAIGFAANFDTLQILLPVGISFYTFQTLSYTIDLYRGRIPVEKNLLNFALYVAFFPQLVAGPIERASSLLPQIQSTTVITWQKLYTGFYLICWGLFKKVVIADNVAKVASGIFALHEPSGLQVLIGAYAFAIQIYCDFSAYSDIARGTAKCMGFDLMLNFNLPYFSTNPSEFWRRWHISLSTWLRDYIYIPLGGNKKGKRRTYVNLMLTMLLGGLWHGAAWTFVLWGAYHGLLLCFHKAIRPFLEVFHPEGRISKPLWYWIRVIVVFHLVCVGWVLFRAQTIGQATNMLCSIFTMPGLSLVENKVFLGRLVPCLFLLGVIQLAQFFKKDYYIFLHLPVPIRSIIYTCLILIVILFGVNESEAFIYFQF